MAYSPESPIISPVEAFNDELNAKFEQGLIQQALGDSGRIELVPDDTFSLVPTAMHAYIKRNSQTTQTSGRETVAPGIWLETHEPKRGVQSNFYAIGGSICVQRFYRRPRSPQELKQALAHSPDGTLPISDEDILSPEQVEELFEWLSLAPPIKQHTTK